MNLSDLEARRGRRIKPLWERLLDYLRRYELRAGAGVRLIQTPDGTSVVADRQRVNWPCRWRVRLVGGLEARVSPGRVAETMATLDGVPLDGLDEEGLPTLTVPPLTLERPKVGNASWVCVRVRPPASVPSATAKAVEVVHAYAPDGRVVSSEADLQAARVSLMRGGAAVQADGWVYFPLAQVRWGEAGATSVVQAATQDLQVGWRLREDGTPGRAFFWPV